MRSRYTLFILALLMTGMRAGAQQYLTQHFNIQDGLAHDNVYRIFQDHRGFLWFCTEYGLSVYNGQSFNSQFNDPDGLLSNATMSIYEDGGLFYVTSYRNGLLVKSDTSVKRYAASKGEYPAFSLKALPDKDNIWVIGKPFLHRISGGAIARCSLKTAGGTEVAFTNIVRCGDYLLACSSNGLYRVNDTTATQYLGDIIPDTVFDAYSAVNGRYFVGCKRRIVETQNGKIVQQYMLGKGEQLKDMLLDHRGRLWIALDGEGMLLLENGVLRNITAALPSSKTVINDMLEDTEGNIWIATYGDGIFKITSTDVLSYKPEGNNPNIYCKTMCGYKGVLLIGSIGKVSMLDNGIIRPFPVRLLKPDYYIYFIRGIDDRLFIGTSQGLIIKDGPGSNEQLIPYSTFYAGLSICKTTTGAILVGDYVSLLRLENGRMVAEKAADNRFANRFNAICQAANGDMWYGTDKGLLHVPVDPARLPATKMNGIRVNDIVQDSHGRIWAATDQGLACVNGQSLMIYTKSEGLPSNRCNKLLEYSNTLWIGTLSGLVYTALDSPHLHRYTTSLHRDDILSLWCNGNSLFAGTVNKLVSLRPGSIPQDTAPPPLYITAARTSRLEALMPVAVSLPYNENKLLISFIALNYKNPGAVEYRYRISGLYDNWYTTRNTYIELPGLPPGNYTFSLQARKNDGPWSREVLLPVIVATPVWKTWWFITAALLAATAMLFFLVQRHAIRNEAKRREQLLQYNKIIHLKQQALSALINPHFIFNCMNSIQYYMDNNENDKANIYLADFAHLVRMTLEDAQKVYISLDKEIARINLYLSLEQLRFGEALEYSMTIDDKLDLHGMYIPNMILQPYIENAIWHGITPNGQGRILITFTYKGNREVEIIVEDNGVGIDSTRKEDPGEDGHYGMTLTEERLALLKAISGKNYAVTANAMKDNDGNTTGTRIAILVTALAGDMALHTGMARENAAGIR